MSTVFEAITIVDVIPRYAGLTVNDVSLAMSMIRYDCPRITMWSPMSSCLAKRVGNEASVCVTLGEPFVTLTRPEIWYVDALSTAVNS